MSNELNDEAAGRVNEVKKWKLVLGILLCGLILGITGCSNSDQKTQNSSQSLEPVELTVSAAISMKDALAELQKSYESSHPGIKISYNLGSSGSLQKQIEEGAPVDLFISAAVKQMDQLESKNLLQKDSRKNLVGNALVIIVPKNSNLNVTKYEDLTQAGIKKVAIGETESVPAGQYAKQVLTKIGLWDSLKEKLVQGKNVRAVLTYVETGNAEAGIVYKTDAAASEQVKIVAAAPQGSHEPIIYPAAIVGAAKHSKEAQEFLNYLASPEGQAVFLKYGFTAPF